MMLTLASVAQAVDGALLGPDRGFDHVCTDTRQTLRDGLFVALRGPNFDGNDYVGAAAEGGAAGALVSRTADIDLSQIQVPDTRLALGQMAQAWRARFDIPVVALTGSNGKTTVRSLIAGILARELRVCATQGNLNNDIGVPLSVMRLRDDHEAAVFELGANHAGEIAYLAGIVAANVVLITNAGNAHLEGFGSLDGVAQAKGELLDDLRADATAVLNADDRYFAQWAARVGNRRVVSFGLTDAADCTVIGDIATVDGESRFVMRLPDGSQQRIALPLPGMHNVRNALAAAACAHSIGVSGAVIAAALSAAEGVGGRLRSVAGLGGARIIDDSYNANPNSVAAALDYLQGLQSRGRVFVFGDMGELGADALQLHREVGEYARGRCDRFIGIGTLAAEAVAGFGAGAEHYSDVADVAAALRDDLDATTTVLIKASRSMRLERLVAALREQPQEQHGGEPC